MELNEMVRLRMRACREAMGYSQMGMAELLHMDERNYKRIESGERKMIDLPLIDLFCEALQISAIYLLLGIERATSCHDEIIVVQWEIIKSQRCIMNMLNELAGITDCK